MDSDLESGQTSRADSVIPDTLYDSLENATNETNESQTVTPPKIQMVTNVLRSIFREDYLPKMVSLGPIHHGDSKYDSEEGYDCKKRLIDDFVQASGQELDYLKQQIENIQQLSDCFEMKVIGGLNNEELASMLCEDGCAILQYIYQPPTHRIFEGIARDILLLENQIPYKVLKELMQLSDKKEELEKSIVNFIKKHANLPSQANLQRDVQIDGDHVHLLDLLRTSLLGNSQAETPNSSKDLISNRNVQELKEAGIHLRRSIDWVWRKIAFIRQFFLLGRHNLPSQANPQRDVQIEGDHVRLLDLLRSLLDLLRRSLLGKSQAETHNSRNDSKSYRNVRELKAAGIHLRRSIDWVWRKIAFIRQFYLLGRLNLPPIIVDNSTRVKVLNLVAYEMCQDFKSDSGVISYLFFLSSLIREAQDVKELRDAGVLDSNIKDKDLPNLFSKICVELGPDPDTYIGVKEEIQKYYGTLMSQMLQFYHAYIKDTSWPLIIAFAVLLDLFFGGTQTLIAVKTWFSVSPAPAPAPQSHS